ncbi:MAG: DUF4139 domain-containing protein [Flavobacteriales bacterium]|nr:DUF4139 domain-containing protein [Flavobacteriales bacterium]
MKKLLFLLSVLITTTQSFAQKEDYIDIDSKITDVTVFLRGAQVERTGSKLIDAGVSKLSFSYLSPDIDPNSIKVSGAGEIIILSVSHSIDYLREGRTHARVKMLEDSIKVIENQIALNNVFYSALNEEWNMIVANKQVNNNTGFDIEDVDDLALYYREQLRKIAFEKQDLAQQNTTLRKVQPKLRKQMGELNSKWNKATSEIIIEVSSKSRSAARLNVSYVVRNAGWAPNYDIRIKDSNSPMTLNYKAKVYQNSGVDWKDVSLKLSTGNPMKNATKPEMYPWRLVFQSQQKYGSYGLVVNGYYRQEEKLMKKESEQSLTLAEDKFFDTKNKVKLVAPLSDLIVMTESQVNTTFDISIPYSVESDGKYHDVSIQSHELAAEYRYFAAPKLDKEAFLLAKVTGWDKLNLLPGQANIFFEGTYTGKSMINPNTTNDTLDLSLGRDPAIVIERDKVDEFCKVQTIGSNKTETVGVKITVRNTKSIPIVLDLTEQVPLSTSKEIEVDILEISNAKHDKKKWLPQLGSEISPRRDESVFS